jgi:hypothetical protein
MRPVLQVPSKFRVDSRGLYILIGVPVGKGARGGALG